MNIHVSLAGTRSHSDASVFMALDSQAASQLLFSTSIDLKL